MNKTLWCVCLCVLTTMITVPTESMAQQLSLDLGEDGGFTSRLIQFFIVLTVLSLAPSILIMMTSFTRVVVVLSFLRSALGTQTTPPNTVIISLALFLTLFIMMPTFEQVYQQGIQPLLEKKIKEDEAVQKGYEPLRDFMLAHVRQDDLKLFHDMVGKSNIGSAEEVSFRALVPAFMISELRRAFEIGFLLYVPFLIIDLLVSSILMSMGMMMLPPVLISLPFKLIFFVLVDGWNLVAGSLIRGYG